VLSIRRAKTLQGKLTLPPSPDLFLVAAVAAIACRRKARIHPVRECPYSSRWVAVLDSCAFVSREGDAVIIDPRPAGPSNTLVFPDDQLPYRDLVVFMALGMRSRVLFRNITEQRLARWREQSQRIGFAVEMIRESDTRGLAPATTPAAMPALPASLVEQDIHPALGLLFGLRAAHTFQVDCTLSTPARDLYAAFGCSITVQRDIGEAEKDPLIRRMRIKARQRLSSQDQLYSVTADFTARAAPGEGPAEPVDILLPGDEVLLALFLAAKSLLPKGSLTIDNAPLEPWAQPVMALMRKMGAKPAQQETHRSAFGPAGIISLQKFELTGQKIDFPPHFDYTFQLPAMAVLAAFAEGQSLFRKFEDLRRSDPDKIKQLEICLRAMHVKFGDIPDGFVIKGGHEHDGFDLIEPLPAPLAGAFAVAGLHCVGSTTVNEGLVLERWPDFSGLLEKFFEYRTSF
jgi:hypothetical protein